MQPGRARTSGLGVPPLLLARCVGCVAPVRPTHGLLIVSCPSAALRVYVCAVSWATWFLFTGVPARCFVFRVRCPGPLGSCSPVCPLSALCFVCGVPGHLAPVHRGARSVCCVACVVSWATWLLFTGVPARCAVLRVRCPGPLGSCSPVRPLGALCCVCGVLGHFVPVHRCSCSVLCVACAVSWATSCLFTGVLARCFVLRVRCPGPLGSCSPVCVLIPLCCVCGVLGHLAPVHRCPRLVRCVACAVSWAILLLFTGVPARCVALHVGCSGPLGSCSLVCPRGLLCCLCGVLGHLAPFHRCAPVVCCVACAVSWATWLLFTGVPARCVVLRVRCPGPLGSCAPVCPPGSLCCLLCLGPLGSFSTVCPRGLLCCVCGVLGHLVPLHRCARSVRCVPCAVSWATWILFTVVPAGCVVLRVRCPGPLGSCSPVCPLGALCCVCAVLGHLAPVHRCACLVRCVVCSVLGHLAPVHHCARSMRCFAGAVSWATWLLFTGVPARCVALHVRCPGPLGSCSPVYPLGALLGVCGVLATLLLFTVVPARCVALRVRCPGPLRSCSPVCPRGLLCCMCGVLGHLAPVHRCACSVRSVACAQSWAAWLVFTVVPARCVALCVRCPGPLGTCSLVCPLGALCCVCGVLGHLAPVHRCARSVRCVACAVSWATWLLFTGVPARFVVLFAVSWATWLLFTGAPARCLALLVRCPGPLGSCSPVCPLGMLLCVCDVLGHLVPLHRCARSVRCVPCAVSWATWILFTGVPARCVVLRVRCPGPLGSCSPVCPLSALCCVCGVLGHSTPVRRGARVVFCLACSVSWATWLLFTGVPAPCVVLCVRCFGPLGSCSPECLLGAFVLRVRRPGLLGSCSPVCPLGALCCVCGVLGHLAPVHRCARVVCCVASALSWATWLLFTGAPARCVALLVRCPGPLGSCSSVCPLGALCCVCGVLGHLAPVKGCARSVRCFACAVSWATWLLFPGVPAWFVVSRVRCLGPLGSCSTFCPLGALCCVCGVLGHLSPVHRCARWVFCVACAVSWATWLVFTGVPARCVVLCVQCLGPLGSCSPECLIRALCCVCGVQGHLAPVHWCDRSVRCVACAVSWPTWLLFTGVPARCVCVACAVSWATWLLFTGVPARCIVLRVR